jgi:hypothetical protein
MIPPLSVIVMPVIPVEGERLPLTPLIVSVSVVPAELIEAADMARDAEAWAGCEMAKLPKRRTTIYMLGANRTRRRGIIDADIVT